MATTATVLRIGPLPDDAAYIADIEVVGVAQAIFLDDCQFKYRIGFKTIGGTTVMNFIKPISSWQDNTQLAVTITDITDSGDKYISIGVNQGAAVGSFYWSGRARVTTIRSVGEEET